MMIMSAPCSNVDNASVATVGESLRWAIAALKKTSTSARMDAETLLGYATGLSRAQLVTRHRQELSATQFAGMSQLIERRAMGEPIAYLTRRQEFWSLEFIVSSSTLIPRSETELLVEQALAVIPSNVAWTIADLGTGCGAIALALAKERPQCRLIAIDSEPAALDVAQRNIEHHKLKNVQCLQGRWFEPINTRINVIVSNPPYIKDDDPHLADGDVRFEPRCALLGGTDGLDALKHIIAHASDYLSPGGQLLLEHGYDQRVAVRALMHHHGYNNVVCHQDIAGRDRVSVCQVQ